MHFRHFRHFTLLGVLVPSRQLVLRSEPTPPKQLRRPEALLRRVVKGEIAMNLMKWFRKNNKKIMAVVVVVIMFGFIAGPTLRYFTRIRTGWHDAVAYFADNKKIIRSDLNSAHQELEILRLLSADDLLRTQDLQAILLSELLFSEQKASPALINRIKRMITTSGYRISDKQISDIYRRSMPADYYWLLLKNEAQLAGISMANEDMGRVLGQVIPQLFRGATYSQVIRSLIDKQGIPEEQILATFGKLLAVLQYSHMICSGEDVTSSQIMHMASQENETINVELVEFESSIFAETLAEPNEDRMVEHFDKYKKFFAGTVSEENPYGFGYKLPDRVQLECIACRLDDVSLIVTPPTPQEKEQYYQKNVKRFMISVPSDPNDPNSPPIEQTQSYAEVAILISDKLLQDKVNSEAEKILQEAKTLTEVGLEDMMDEGRGTRDERQTGDYTAAAEQLSKKHKIKIYAGQTGLLAATDIRNDRNLGMLYLKTYGTNPVALTQLVFAIDELKASDLGLFNMPKPRMYENIGPLRDLFGEMIVLVRVIKAEPASEPKSINQAFSTSTPIFDPNQEKEGKDIYSVREKVAEDLKKSDAMDTTRIKAEEFLKLAAKDGLDNTINKFNDLYGPPFLLSQESTGAKKDPNDPNVFQVETLTDLQRISSTMLATLAVQNASNPAVQFIINEVTKQAWFIDQLYSLVPQDSNTVDNAPLIMEFKPNMSFYIIKNISVKHLTHPEYEKIKALRLYKEDRIQTQSMAAVHFNPENILKRMNFRWANRDESRPLPQGRDEGTTDANAPAESVRLSSPSKSEEPS